MSSPTTSNKTFTSCPSSGPAAHAAARHQASSTIPRPPVLPGNLGTYLRRVTPANQKAVDPTRFCVGSTLIIPPRGGGSSLAHLGATRELLFDYLLCQSLPHTTLPELD